MAADRERLVVKERLYFIKLEPRSIESEFHEPLALPIEPQRMHLRSLLFTRLEPQPSSDHISLSVDV